MIIDLLIRGGTVVRESGASVSDIAIADGRIVEIKPMITGGARAELDARGLHVFPGVVDPHVHFNEPGRTDWEGFATGSSALAAGGGTCFFDMPLNSSPPTLDGESFDLKRQAAEQNSYTDFALWGGLTPRNLDRMEELAERGVIGFKAFMCDSGMDEFLYADPDTLEKGMRIAAALKLPVAVHAEDPQALDRARRDVTGHSWRDYLRSRPIECESLAVRRVIACARETGCPLHIVHVSSPLVLDTIESERQRGAAVTCETCPHYLLLSDEDLPRIGARAKCAPPLREKRSLEPFAARLESGGIDFVASDHSPAPESMKRGDDVFAVWGGIAGAQSTLPAMLTIHPRPSLERVAALTAGNVARRFGIESKGDLAPGFDADLALIDISAKYELARDMLLDRHKLSPYVGMQFHGLVKRTILRGRTIFLDGKMIGKPQGRLITPTR